MEKQEISVTRTIRDIQLKPYEHRTKYYETDISGTIHQSNYVKWIEDARIDIMEQLGLGSKQMEEMKIVCPIMSQSIDYLGMVRFDETVVIETRVSRYDGKNIEFDYQITDKATGKLRATARSSHCFFSISGDPISVGRIYPELGTTAFEFK